MVIRLILPENSTAAKESIALPRCAEFQRVHYPHTRGTGCVVGQVANLPRLNWTKTWFGQVGNLPHVLLPHISNLPHVSAC